MIRVGFLSAVRHAQSYLDVLGADPRVRLVGVAEETDAAQWIQSDSRAFAASHDLRFYDTPHELLAPGECDVVVVCSEPTRHAKLAVLALDAGRNVLVDKPVAVSVSEADEIAAAEQRSAGTVTIINRLASPALARMRSWVDAGYVGLPLHVDVEWFASKAHFATSVERTELVVDPRLSGGGELLNFLLYPVDSVRALTGLEVTDVYAEASTLFNDSHRQTGVEDTAVVSLLLEHGVTATITLGRVAAAPGDGPVSSSIRLIGSRGFATSDDDQPSIVEHTNAGVSVHRPIGGPSSGAIVHRFLADCVDRWEAGTAPAYRLEDARAALAVTEACYNAIHAGQPVSLTPRKDRP